MKSEGTTLTCSVSTSMREVSLPSVCSSSGRVGAALREVLAVVLAGYDLGRLGGVETVVPRAGWRQ